MEENHCIILVISYSNRWVIVQWFKATKIRLIMFFAAKDGDTLYSQEKQDCELTVAPIMNSSLPNSDLN